MQQWRINKVQHGLTETQINLLLAEIRTHATIGRSFESLKYKVRKKIKDWTTVGNDSDSDVRTNGV